VVRDHVEQFLYEARRGGDDESGIPRFVENWPGGRAHEERGKDAARRREALSGCRMAGSQPGGLGPAKRSRAAGHPGRGPCGRGGRAETEDALLREAFFKVEIFKNIFEHYNGSELPELKYLGNTLVDKFGLDQSLHEEFRQLFLENCKYLSLDRRNSSRRPTGSPGGVMETEEGTTSLIVLSTPERPKGVCFVAMPFTEHEETHPPGFFQEVLKSLIVPAGEDAGFKVITARREGSDVIQATIVNGLLEADMVVADLTENNPNVLFELGLRIAKDKPVALIRSKTTRAIFDVDSMLRVFEYDPNLWKTTIDDDVPRLSSHLKAAWESRSQERTYMKILVGS
jgi:hypothetical protein